MTLNPDDARCFPVCAACREAGVCASGKPAEKVKESGRSAEWAPNRLPYVTLTCGCKGIAWPAYRALGSMVDSIWCDTHDKWVTVKVPRPRKNKKQEVDGQDEMVPF